eukprot:scaffold7998_cov417-Prasinococcus_capsulatus_cf.AAC.7
MSARGTQAGATAWLPSPPGTSLGYLCCGRSELKGRGEVPDPPAAQAFSSRPLLRVQLPLPASCSGFWDCGPSSTTTSPPLLPAPGSRSALRRAPPSAARGQPPSPQASRTRPERVERRLPHAAGGAAGGRFRPSAGGGRTREPSRGAPRLGAGRTAS